MINAHMTDRKHMPWWAAIAAPLVGIPAIVAILALAAPNRTDQGAVETAPVRVEAEAFAVDVAEPVATVEFEAPTIQEG